ncbi:TIM-barrel domain-containing protein [Mucilaginibacter litoreus]|uniref:TIM-barrel domain-containing protein n=1 Tax=Mucilaginibacter litoreus TaxID=1048221 RepID=A0ABW3ARD7_9SPHI
MLKIKRRFYICIVVLSYCTALFGQSKQVTELAPGVKKITVGSIDKFTPYSFCDEKPQTAAMEKLKAGKLPFDINNIAVQITDRGVLVDVPLDADEQLYGFGLQIGSFNQRGLRKKPIVNDNPSNDLGYTHGPTTFYISNKGYGILINTTRYTTFYCGTTEKNLATNNIAKATGGGNSVEELYSNKNNAEGYVEADIPGAKGIEVFVFEGPDMISVMQRYNLFSGGGAMPAIWGLGVKYRVKADFKQDQVKNIANYFRNNHIPCDVLGLEPKWQTTAYSCSYVWNPAYFPAPKRLIDSMKLQGFKLNLWEHAFVNPASPLYTPLKKRSGDYLVWGGLVPDFADTSSANIFAAYHDKTFVKEGISGFKMDECDNSNISFGNATWSFPEHSRFPSGIDGEQMHQVFGLLYQKSIYNIYKHANIRTYLDVRASNAFASSYPAVLYSDTYDHDEYIRMVVNSGFSGMLWSPEVRESSTIADLMRRSQTAVLSAQTLYNSWYLKNPPWLQIKIDENNKNQLMDNSKQIEADVRKLLEFRMSLIPYLYDAFADYHYKGIPPFRALVVDYPNDKRTYNVSNEYMIGQSILAAPLTEKQNERKVYLPAGNWYNFNTGEKLAGDSTYTIATSFTELPIFIKEGTILPLAKPVEHVSADTKFEITCRVYGNEATGSLFEDDGVTFDYNKGGYNTISLNYKSRKGTANRKGKYKFNRYFIKSWQVIR